MTWAVPVGGPMAGVALGADGGAYMPSDHGVVYCLDAASGGMRWQLQLLGEYSGPVMAGSGTVYFAALDGYGVYAVDTEAVQQPWNFAVPNSVIQTPAVGHGNVYVVDTTGSMLYAIDAATGAQVFAATVPDTAMGSPVLGLDGVYVATQAGIATFDPDTGAASWQAPEGAQAMTQPALLSDGDVVAATGSGSVFVLAHATGATVNSFSLGDTIATGGGGIAPVIDANDTAYLATAGSIAAVRPDDGQVVWRTTAATGQPTLADHALVVKRAQGNFVVIAP